MKKQIVALLLFVTLVLFAGCSGKPASGGAVTVPSSSAETATVDLSTLPEQLDAQAVAAIKDRDDVLVIDVREQSEYDAGHIPGITLIPMNSVPNRLSEIPTDKTVVLACHSGNRSSQVFDYLKQQGYTNIHNLQGGIMAWQGAGLPVEQ